MKIAIIAVIDENNGIGKENKLLCHLPADLKRFKQLTTGFPVIMGRKTFQSLPNGPLPNRRNIIISRDSSFTAEGCEVVHSEKEALDLCRKEEKVFIIGGGQIYAIFFQFADILHITKIHHKFDSDTLFPEINENEWIECLRADHTMDEKNSFDYSFIDYSRKFTSK